MISRQTAVKPTGLDGVLPPILYPYTAERRDVLGNTSPEAREISRGQGFCTPRPERFPEGEARGKSRGPRGAKSPPEGNLKGRGGCISQCIPTRGSVRIQYHRYRRNTGNTKYWLLASKIYAILQKWYDMLYATNTANIITSTSFSNHIRERDKKKRPFL